ncbi:MAG: glycosyltransferase family 4 protein [Acidobacteria bacterium]|nr:glycosyltransferase family 4 protein [Acidobacteriota bacterium]
MTETQKIKVLLVAPRSPMIGGQAIQAARIYEGLISEDEIEIAIQPINPQFFPALQKIKFLRTILTSLKYIFDLLLKIPRYDVIHIFSASYFSFILAPTPAILISKLFGKKSILNYRSGEAKDHLKNWKRTAIPIIRLADSVIVPSGYLVDVFSDFGIEAKAIFNFVDADKLIFRKREVVRPVFLSNRNFEELYNVSCTLRAFKIIQTRYPNAKLILAGDGKERDKLKKLVGDLKLENCEFRGQVTPEEMGRLYDEADIYLNSPNIDNMPNSIIEAYASGIPVVSTEAGGIPYIVDQNRTGILAGIDDEKALAEGVFRLLEDKGLALRIAENAKEESQKYQWPAAREKWIEEYKTLAK